MIFKICDQVITPAADSVHAGRFAGGTDSRQCMLDRGNDLGMAGLPDVTHGR